MLVLHFVFVYMEIVNPQSNFNTQPAQIKAVKNNSSPHL